MTFTFYSGIIMLTELFMLAMTLHVIFYSGFTKTQKGWYLVTFISIMICALAEFAVHCGYYDPAWKIPLTILTVIQFSLAPLLGVFFAGAIGLHKQAKLGTILFSTNLLVEIIAAPFGWIFYFDDTGYSRGNLFLIYEIFFGISVIYLSISMIRVGRKFRHRDFWTIGMVMVIIIAGIIPMAFFKVNITYMAIAIASAICYIYYNDLVQQDIMTDFKASQKKVTSMQNHIISGLSNLIENRDMETGGHILRTSSYVKLIAEEAKKEGVYGDQIDDVFISRLYTLAPLHDIGKVVVSDRILKKPGRLNEEEYEEMKKHADAGGRIVRDILKGITEAEYISFASDIAKYHHEWWNGKGYPCALKGEDIPLCARIMAIADVFDALVSHRCYKDPIPAEEAFRAIEEGSGTHFDPALVSLVLKNKEKFIEIMKSEQ